MIEKDCTKLSGWEAIKCIWHEYSYLWIVPAFFLGITLGFSLGYSIQQDFDFLKSMIPEITGIGITVSAIYYFDRWRQDKMEEKRLKKQLIREAGSRDNSTAVSAIDWLRHEGWLNGENSLLNNAFLVNADLEGANLMGASLTKAKLGFANLTNADLMGAYLYRVDLSFANLTNANLLNTYLRNANLSATNFTNAHLEDCYFIEAHLGFTDLTNANLTNCDFTDAELGGMTLPDGTTWTPETDMGRFTDSEHPDFWQPPEKE